VGRPDLARGDHGWTPGLMTSHPTGEDRPYPAGGRDPDVEPTSRLRGFLLVESASLLAALALPLVPPRTGGGTLDPADWLFDDPGYLVNVVVGFLVVNAMIGVLGVILGLLAGRE